MRWLVLKRKINYSLARVSLMCQDMTMVRLTRDQELEAFEKLAKGDQKAGDLIARTFMPFAAAVAREYLRYGLPESDICAEAYSGLFHAMRKFKPSFRLKFSTYSVFWIRAYVISYVLRTLSPVSGSPAYSSKHFFRLRREYAKCIQATCGDDDAARALVMTNLGLTADRYADMQAPVRAPMAEEPLSEPEGQGFAYPNVIPDPGPSPEDQCLASRRQDDIAAVALDLLGSLTPREQSVIIGQLMSDEPYSFAAIGRSLGLSRERTRQIFKMAMKKLRDAAEASNGREAL